MAIFIYGVTHKTKHMGYFGPAEECPCCHKTYQKSFIRTNTWAHVDYVPLFPVKFRYVKACPVCGIGTELKAKEAKAEMAASAVPSTQRLEVYGKHILANKPSGMFKTDNSYEFWVKDLNSGEEVCVASSITKAAMKNMKKARGIKNMPVYDIKG